METKHTTDQPGANAKLIAAAPDLLDTCQAMLEYFKIAGQENSVLAKSIEIAIKKATT